MVRIARHQQLRPEASTEITKSGVTARLSKSHCVRFVDNDRVVGEQTEQRGIVGPVVLTAQGDGVVERIGAVRLRHGDDVCSIH